MDLSWPMDMSVNVGVEKIFILILIFQLHYPSVDNITSALNKLGSGAMLYKINIDRAFRHIRIDPGDTDLLGIFHKRLYIDQNLPFGFRHGLIFCQKCSDAIHHIMRCHGFPGL